MKTQQYLIIILILSACVSEPSQKSDTAAEELVYDSEYYDSLKHSHRDILERLNVEGHLKKTEVASSPELYQYIEPSLLSKDTLRVTRMGSYYAIERRDLKDFNRFYDQSAIAIRDIDTNEVSFWVREDVMYVMLPTRDTLQATWGKFDSKLNRWKFKVPANEVILAYLTSNEKIKSNFESHIMFSPEEGKPIDFTLTNNNDMDTLKMFNEVKSVLRKYWKN